MMSPSEPGWYYADGDPPGMERYWDGAQWTFLQRGDAHYEDMSGTQLAKDARKGIGVRVVEWLAPLVVLGGVGVLLMNAGSSESTGTFGQVETEFSGMGVTGMGFVCLAAAVFFGRGSIPHALKVAKGEGTLGDIFTVRGSLIGSLVALGALIAGVVLIFIGITNWGSPV